MWNIPNVLTLLRFPLALLFIPPYPEWRTVILLVAAATDGMDGFIARYFKQTSPLGTLLDPLMDKFFAAVIIAVLVMERKLTAMQCLILFGRDIAVFAYGFLLWFKGQLAKYKVRAIWTGKLMTCLQFVTFLYLVWKPEAPAFLYIGMAMISCLAFLELLYREEASQADA